MEEDIQRVRYQGLNDYEFQLFLLEQQNKRRAKMIGHKMTGHETKALSSIRLLGHIVEKT